MVLLSDLLEHKDMCSSISRKVLLLCNIICYLLEYLLVLQQLCTITYFLSLVTLFIVLVSLCEDTVWNFRNTWSVTHAVPIVTHLKFEVNSNYSCANPL